MCEIRMQSNVWLSTVILFIISSAWIMKQSDSLRPSLMIGISILKIYTSMLQRELRRRSSNPTFPDSFTYQVTMWIYLLLQSFIVQRYLSLGITEIGSWRSRSEENIPWDNDCKTPAFIWNGRSFVELDGKLSFLCRLCSIKPTDNATSLCIP
jgi:hypothetical protein